MDGPVLSTLIFCSVSFSIEAHKIQTVAMQPSLDHLLAPPGLSHCHWGRPTAPVFSMDAAGHVVFYRRVVYAGF